MAGRPSLYNDSILDKSIEYLENYQEYEDLIPSVEGLAEVLGIARSTIYLWANDDNKQEFIDILERINAKQKRVLLNKGLSGEFNSNITKLALGKHGYSEKQEIDHSMTVTIDSQDAETL